jgi:hypothetical protein
MKKNPNPIYSKEDLNTLTNFYQSVEVPADLERRLLTMKNNHLNPTTKKQTYLRIALAIGGTLCSLCLLFALAVNVSPAFASSMEGVPFIGSAARLVTFGMYQVNGENTSAEISGAEISSLDNTDLQDSLNEKYLDQAKSMYDDFMSKIDAGDDHLYVFSEYNVVADNGTTISIENVQDVIQASASESKMYDTVDVKNGLYITLPSLFKDDTYIERINEIITSQIEDRVAAGEGQFFDGEEGFQTITADQPFYISNDHKLVISFDEYLIAPGYMGVVQFEIPTDSISDLLVGSEYIQ